MQTSISLERHEVDLRLVIVGGQAKATRLQDDLGSRLEAIAGVKPSIQVVAVPDAQTLHRVEATMSMPARPPAPAPHADLQLLRRQADDVLGRAWPEEEAGPLVGWTMRFLPVHGEPTVQTAHLGPPIGPAGEHLLAGQLSSGLGYAVTVSDIGLPVEPAIADADSGAAWVAAAVQTLDVLRRSSEVYVCVRTPEDSRGKPLRGAEAIAEVDRQLPAFKRDWVSFLPGPRWEMRLSTSPCVSGIDGGAADAAE